MPRSFRRPRKPSELVLAEPVEPRLLLATFTVSSAADSGQGTLRAAIAAANATAASDVVVFNLPDPGPIRLAGPLPDVLHPLTIDGRTQPGFAGTPLVRINGLVAGPNVTGLRLVGRTELYSVAVVSFLGDGIVLGGGGQHVVRGCYVGVDPVIGDANPGNGGDGIEVNSSGNEIGAASAEGRNVISGNGGSGVRITRTGADPASGNHLKNNYIGLAPHGRTFLRNAQHGVQVGTPGNFIGGANSGEGNFISGNALNNVLITGAAAAGNVVRRNTIGLTGDDRWLDAGGGGGVAIIDAPNNTVGGDSPVLGNVISGNATSGVTVQGGSGATGNRIVGNVIGANRSASGFAPNQGHGVQVSARNTAVLRNNISGNRQDGVRVEGSGVRAVTVEDNLIGIGAVGSFQPPMDLGNIGNGVSVYGADGVSVLRNIIAGNNSNGIRVTGPTGTTPSAGVSIRGNLIGDPFPNDFDGVMLDGPRADVTVGGTAAEDRNAISGNGRHGVYVNSQGVSVLGNWIGIDSRGTAARPNRGHGVVVASAGNIYPTVIGGAAPNVISGNALSGVALVNLGSYVTVQRNLIGTNTAGTAAVPNGQHGVELRTLQVDLVDNTISGNAGSGVFITGVELGISNRVQGNRIGTNAAGTAALPNQGHGVWVGERGRDNVIGGSAAGQGNTIAFNGLNGVTIAGQADDNAIVGNSIHSNGGMGIDLGDNGVTANDPRDPDTGANDLQNFPVLTGVTTEGGNVTVRGTLDSVANARFRIEFFANDFAGTSAQYEGQRPVGSTTVTTSATGAATFEATLPAPAGEVFTATATRLTSFANLPFESTSEFSPPVPVTLPAPRVADVFVRGGAWTSNFLAEVAADRLGDANLGFRVGPGQPGSIVLPWSNVDRLTFRFNRDVNVQREDLSLSSGARLPYAVSQFAYDPATFTATWTFDRPLADYPRLRRSADVLLFVLDGTSPDGVYAGGGPSGPPVFLPGDFTQRLYAVPGDANRNGSVSPTDIGTIRSGIGRTVDDEGTAPNDYTLFKDVNANGNVSPTDIGIVRGNTGANISDVPQPAQTPAAAEPSITSDLFASDPLLA